MTPHEMKQPETPHADTVVTGPGFEINPAGEAARAAQASVGERLSAEIRAPRLSPSEQLLRWFESSHLGDETARTVSEQCGALARLMEDMLPSGPELTTGLRKLLEAKDCFVRSALTP